MAAYIALALLIAVPATFSDRKRVESLLWLCAGLLIVIFIGLRHHVGMDWNNYLRMIQVTYDAGLAGAFSYAEPGYAILLWVAAELGAGVYLTNFIGSLIFTCGLMRYSSTTPRPWLALMTALPMLVIVVSMSANRQAIAIGVLLWLTASWRDVGVLGRVAFVLVAACFHTSALFFLIFAMAGLNIRPALKYPGLLIVISGMIAVLVATGYASYYDQAYLSGQDASTTSTGALFHVFLNAGPALFLCLGSRVRSIMFPDVLHRNMALLAIVLLFTATLMSAASGRLSLYLFPVSMYTISAFPSLFNEPFVRLALRAATAMFMVGLAAFWLQFSNSGHAHIPYGNYLTTPPQDLVHCCE